MKAPTTREVLKQGIRRTPIIPFNVNSRQDHRYPVSDPVHRKVPNPGPAHEVQDWSTAGINLLSAGIARLKGIQDLSAENLEKVNRSGSQYCSPYCKEGCFREPNSVLCSWRLPNQLKMSARLDGILMESRRPNEYPPAHISEPPPEWDEGSSNIQSSIRVFLQDKYLQKIEFSDSRVSAVKKISAASVSNITPHIPDPEALKYMLMTLAVLQNKLVLK